MIKKSLVSVVFYLGVLGSFLYGQQTFPLFHQKEVVHNVKQDGYHLPFHRMASVMLDERILDWTSKSFQVGDHISIDLFDGIVYNSVIDRVNLDGNGTFSLRSRIEGYEGGYMILTLAENNTVLADIRIPEKRERYSIKTHHDKGMTVLKKVDASRLDYIEPGPSLIADEKIKLSSEKQKILEEAAMRGDDQEVAHVNVMVVYTANAESWANANDGSIHNTIALAMESAQLALDNSEILMEMTMAVSYEVDYTESGSSSTDLERMTGIDNGYMDDVHITREYYEIDLVSLFSFVSDTGGIAWLLNSRYGRPETGFSITRVQQASSSYTHIHEMGHNMGAHHSKYQNFQPGPTVWVDWPENTWSAGWRWHGTDGQLYCDLMTYTNGSFYDDGETAEEVPYFSDPYIYYMGDATGNYYDGNNKRTISELRHVIAAYGLEPAEPPVPLCEALGNCDIIFTTFGDALWLSQSDTVFDGENAARSGAVGDDQYSSLQAMVEGPGKAGFHWKVSSEEHYDFLVFYVNGEEKQRISGETEWIHVEYPVGEGVHTLEWTYVKDLSLSQGSDAGWLDMITFEQGTFGGEDREMLLDLPPVADLDGALYESAMTNMAEYEVAMPFDFDTVNTTGAVVVYGAYGTEDDGFTACDPEMELYFTVRFYQDDENGPVWEEPYTQYASIAPGIIQPMDNKTDAYQIYRMAIPVPDTPMDKGWFSVQSAHESCKFLWVEAQDNAAQGLQYDHAEQMSVTINAVAAQLFGYGAAPETPTYPIELALDMSNAIATETFEPSTHKVYVSGSFNEWTEPGTPESVVLEAPAAFSLAEDFDGYEDFATDMAPWIVVAHNESPTTGDFDFTFPGAGEHFGFMTFNPSATTPPVDDIHPAYSGSKYLVAAQSQSVTDDKWLISPSLALHPTGEFRFMARSYSDSVPERMVVWLSQTGTQEGDFVKFSEGEFIEVPSQWTEYVFQMDAIDATDGYIAVQYVSEDAYMLMLDDFEYVRDETDEEFVYRTTLQLEEGVYTYKYFSDAIGEGFDGAEWQNNHDRTLVADEQKTIYDYWGELFQDLYALSLHADPPAGGTTTGSGDYIEGISVDIKAVPANGYTFGFWSSDADDNILSYEEEYALEMPGYDIELTAVFKLVSEVPHLQLADFSVFPNPAQDRVSISANFPMERIMITDIKGRVFYNQRSHEQEKKINISHLSTGLYLVRVQTQEGLLVRKLQIVR